MSLICIIACKKSNDVILPNPDPDIFSPETTTPEDTTSLKSIIGTTWKIDSIIIG